MKPISEVARSAPRRMHASRPSRLKAHSFARKSDTFGHFFFPVLASNAIRAVSVTCRGPPTTIEVFAARTAGRRALASGVSAGTSMSDIDTVHRGVGVVASGTTSG